MGRVTKLLLEKKYDVDGKSITDYDNGFNAFSAAFMDGQGDEDLLAIREFVREEYIYLGREPFHIDKDFSNWTYFGKKLSYDEVVDLWCETGNEKYHTAMENMARHGINYVCESRKGNIFEMGEEDNLAANYMPIKRRYKK